MYLSVAVSSSSWAGDLVMTKWMKLAEVGLDVVVAGVPDVVVARFFVGGLTVGLAAQSVLSAVPAALVAPVAAGTPGTALSSSSCPAASWSCGCG